jgi:hypothetical protein
MLGQPNCDGQLKLLAGGHCCGFWVGHPSRVGQASTADGLQWWIGCVNNVGQAYTDG